jgi:hypothetical protein
LGRGEEDEENSELEAACNLVLNEKGIIIGVRSPDCTKFIYGRKKYCENCIKYRRNSLNEIRNGSVVFSATASLVKEPSIADLVGNLKSLLNIEGMKGDHFLITVIEQMLHNLKAVGTEGFRYPDVLFHFAMTIQWYGGTTLLNILRGCVVYDDSGGMHLNGINIPLPSARQIARRVMSCEPMKLKQIPSWAANLLKDLSGTATRGGIVFDEVDVRTAVQYLHEWGVVMGLTEVIYEKEIHNLRDEEIAARLATKILQIFL